MLKSFSTVLLKLQASMEKESNGNSFIFVKKLQGKKAQNQIRLDLSKHCY